MTLEEVIHKATQHGNDIGQVALSEFLLKNYGDSMEEDLCKFLRKVCEKSHNAISETIGVPAEDVALQINQVMARH